MITRDEMSTGYRDLLCWIAGAQRPAPDTGPQSEELLLTLVASHGLAGRLARKIAESNVGWITPTLRRAAARLENSTVRTMRQQTSALEEICRSPGMPAQVLIKGISTFLLTGRQHTVRWGDIDLICADGAATVDVLTELGYVRTRNPFMHEIGEFTSGSIEIDLHDHFPVHRYGAHPERSGSSPKAAGWQPFEASQVCKINYGDALAGARRVLGDDGGGGVLVPDPCLLAIIFCAHAYMNFTNIWSISHREKPYVRLGELADIADLADTDDFDLARFHSLVERFHAHDAVEWAGWASEALLGFRPFPPSRQPLHATGEAHAWPRCLWWTFWTDVPVSTSTLVMPAWFDAGEMVDRYDAATHDLRDRSSTATLIPRVQGESRISTVADQTAGDIDERWSFEIKCSGAELVVSIGLVSNDRTVTERVRVDFGQIASEWVGSKADDSATVVGEPVAHSMSRRGDRRWVNLSFPLERLISVTDDTDLPLIVGVLEQAEDGTVLTAGLLPLRILVRSPALKSR